MDDTQAMNHEPSDVDRNSSGGAVPEFNEADQPDQPTVDDRSDDEAGAPIDVGILVAHSPGGDVEPLRSFAERMAHDGVEELAAATDAAWRIHCADPDPLTDRASRRPSEFLNEAALHMTKRPYDLVVVVTDVPLTTREERSVEGLASPLARIVVVSTRRLLRTHDREAVRALNHRPSAGTLRPSSFTSWDTCFMRTTPIQLLPCPKTATKRD